MSGLRLEDYCIGYDGNLVLLRDSDTKELISTVPCPEGFGFKGGKYCVYYHDTEYTITQTINGPLIDVDRVTAGLMMFGVNKLSKKPEDKEKVCKSN